MGDFAWYDHVLTTSLMLDNIPARHRSGGANASDIDMVEYFGEHLDGFVFIQNGWVQSYGSRCVKPPIIIGDISRPKAC